MPTLIETTLAALSLLFSGDAELWQVVGVSFSVSGLALGLVLLPALLLGFALAYLPFRRAGSGSPASIPCSRCRPW